MTIPFSELSETFLQPFCKLSEEYCVDASELVYTSPVSRGGCDFPELLESVSEVYTKYLEKVLNTDESINFFYNAEANEGWYTANNFKITFTFDSHNNRIYFGDPGEAVFYGSIPLETFKEELNVTGQYGLVTSSLAGHLSATTFSLYSFSKLGSPESMYVSVVAKPLFANYFHHFNALKRNDQDLTTVYKFESRLLSIVEKVLTDAFSQVVYEIFETIEGLHKALKCKEFFVNYMESLNDGGVYVEEVVRSLLGDAFKGFDKSGALLFDAELKLTPDPMYEEGIKVLKTMCNQIWWGGRDCSLAELIELVDLLRRHLTYYTKTYAQVCSLHKRPEHAPFFIVLNKLGNFVSHKCTIDEALTAWHDLYDTMDALRFGYKNE